MSDGGLPPAMFELLAPPAQPEESVFTAAPSRQVHFLTDHVTPPSDLYLAPDDSLRVSVYSATAGLTVGIKIRYVRPTGELIYTEETLTTLALPNPAVGNYRMGEGFLLSVAVVGTSAGMIRGMVYVKVDVIRAFGGPGPNFSYTLVESYVTSTTAATWPVLQTDFPVSGQGNLVAHFVGNPGPGNPLLFSQAATLRWRLLAAFINFQTSAGVGTRFVQMQLAIGGQQYINQICQLGQVPSTQQFYSVAPGLPIASFTGNLPNIAWPVDARMPPGTTLSVTSTLAVAGDDFLSGAFLTEEWIDT